MDPPTNFRAAETFPLDPRLLTEHHLRCPLCKSMLKDPVSIPCGHNYCRGCINEFWDNCAGDYVCPQCGNPSETRPVLNTNAALAEVVRNLQQAGFSPALPPQPYARPEDVACDFCTERRLKAVKCCSTCGVSLCETHVKQHYTIPALQKHTLLDVTGDMKTRPSQQHQNTDSSFSSTVSGQQHQTDKTQDIIKEMAVRSFFETVLNTAKVQTRPKRPAKTFRPKTKDNEDVRSLARMCSTLQQEVSGLKKNLSRLKAKKRRQKETYHDDKKDYGEEDDDEEEEDYEEEDDDEEVNEHEKEYAEEEEDYGEEDEEEEDEDDDSSNSEKDFDAESDEEVESDEDGYDDDEEGNTDDYDGEEDDEDDRNFKEYDDEDYY
ncbi:E3 ubiquitin/ISG15 ligase TRIM25 [Labeo rohita]|nr:E3 ubiquitin/ISG15 ligase TRIM25 [Labeo rohita]